VVRDYPGLYRRTRDGGWAYEDLLHKLLEAEITDRHQSTARRLLREARFPDYQDLRPARLGGAQGRVTAKAHGAGDFTTQVCLRQQPI
jgi:hypothetical protein